MRRARKALLGAQRRLSVQQNDGDEKGMPSDWILEQLYVVVQGYKGSFELRKPNDYPMKAQGK